MSTNSNPDRREDVLSVLRDLEAFMRRHGIVAWAKHLQQLQAEASTDAGRLKRRVIDLYGTMGSLTDLIVSRVNGHDVDDEDAANAELERMVHELWARVNAL